MKPLLQTLWMILVCAVFLSWIPAHARPLRKPLSFQHFTQKDGLPSELISAIATQGDEVWVGTYAGGANLYHKLKKNWRAYDEARQRSLFPLEIPLSRPSRLTVLSRDHEVLYTCLEDGTYWQFPLTTLPSFLEVRSGNSLFGLLTLEKLET